MHIVIDGYNLIRQSERFRSAERAGLEAGRSRLLKELSGYNKTNSHRITVVFDGWRDGSPHEEQYRRDGIDIVYSRKGEPADDVIKRMTRQVDREILVVTSDRDIASSVTKAGGVALSSAQFELKLLEGTAHKPDPVDYLDDEDDEGAEAVVTRKKKGPARKLSRRERKMQQAVRKL